MGPLLSQSRAERGLGKKLRCQLTEQWGENHHLVSERAPERRPEKALICTEEHGSSSHTIKRENKSSRKSVPRKEAGSLWEGDGSAQYGVGIPGLGTLVGMSGQGGMTIGTITIFFYFLTLVPLLAEVPSHTESLSKCSQVPAKDHKERLWPTTKGETEKEPVTNFERIQQKSQMAQHGP